MLWLKQSELHSDYQANGTVPIKSYLDVDTTTAQCKVPNRLKPDIVYDCGTHYVVVSCDEHSHPNYTCEHGRMHNVTQALGLPTYWIRYNPDPYWTVTHKQDHPHFKLSTNKKCDPSMSHRKKVLFEMISVAKQCKPQLKLNDASIEPHVVYLFYDGDHPLKHRTFQSLSSFTS